MKKFKFFFKKENDGIFAFGNNHFGQLGLGNGTFFDMDTQYKPKNVSFFNKMKIRQISCGYHHTLVLTG